LSEEAINPKESRILEVMTDSPITCHPEDPLETVIRMMEENQIRRIPVVDQQGKCIGIIAQADIALADVNKQEVSTLVEELSK
jgi:CBS domain-containing protein